MSVINSQKTEHVSINLEGILSNDAKKAFDDWTNKRYTK